MKVAPDQHLPASSPAFENPTISVVIPAYNAGEFLREALNSVLAQTYPPLEVIVVDDGSEDHTPEIAAAFAGSVKYMRKERGGPASARNVGIRAASGEWIAFLDSDDIWMPDLLEKLVRAASETQAGFVFCDSWHLIDGKAEGPSRLESYGLKSRLNTLAPNGVLLDPFRLLLEERCYIFTPGVLIKRNALLEVSLFDESFYCGEDLDLWLRLSLRQRFAVIGDVLHLRRIHGKNTGYNWWAKARGDLQVYNKLEESKPAAAKNPTLRRLLRRKKARAYRDLGALHLTQMDLPAARENLSKSLESSFSAVSSAYWLITFVPGSWLAAALDLRKKIKCSIPPSASPNEVTNRTTVASASDGQSDTFI